MYRIKIENMNCMSCFHNIEDVLKDLDPNITAQPDIKNKLLSVETERPLDEIKELIKSAGYPVQE
ncbi:MAG: heavy-metal-associated domain-containing protein [Bdellovibrionales bacterium]|nr:heavy-metal-associated domain-containing protein [Bdellovibrionales bacterium]